MRGPIDPHDVLAVLGIKELQRYLVDKIQEVYRSQSVAINDKHIEVICRQMLRSVRVTRVGDTDFLVDEQVDRFRFMEENEKVMNRGGEPADGTPLLLGITKASLSTDSFISAAWFQVRWTDAGEPPVECARGDLRLRLERRAHRAHRPAQRPSGGIRGDALVLRAKSTGKNPVYYVLGQTDAGRHLLCVVISFRDGKGYPVLPET
jgi:hypothetical protein